MSKQKLLPLSIFLSLISVTLTVIINLQIAKAFENADGKTKATFGLTEVLRFCHQYYIVIIGLTSAFLAFRGIGTKTYKYTACILSIVAIAIVFLKIWRLFIHC